MKFHYFGVCIGYGVEVYRVVLPLALREWREIPLKESADRRNIKQGAGTKAKQERATYKGSSVVTQYIFLDLFPSYDNKLLKS